MQSKRFDKCGKNLLKLLLIGFLIKLWKIDGRPRGRGKGIGPAPRGLSVKAGTATATAGVTRTGALCDLNNCGSPGCRRSDFSPRSVLK